MITEIIKLEKAHDQVNFFNVIDYLDALYTDVSAHNENSIKKENKGVLFCSRNIISAISELFRTRWECVGHLANTELGRAFYFTGYFFDYLVEFPALPKNSSVYCNSLSLKYLDNVKYLSQDSIRIMSGYYEIVWEDIESRFNVDVNSLNPDDSFIYYT